MTAQKFIFKLMEFKVEQLYDDCFYVQEKKYGLWYSTDKEGNGLITSLTEESCVSATRQYLKWKQENRLNDVGVSYEGTVGGKL
jgi:hypothetical protein